MICQDVLGQIRCAALQVVLVFDAMGSGSQTVVRTLVSGSNAISCAFCCITAYKLR